MAATNGGVVAKSPNQANYISGTQVTLTATANSGYQFSGWSGDAAGAIEDFNDLIWSVEKYIKDKKIIIGYSKRNHFSMGAQSAIYT